jgi:hypothetical protein
MVRKELRPIEKRLKEQKNILIHVADPKYALMQKESVFV